MLARAARSFDANLFTMKLTLSLIDISCIYFYYLEELQPSESMQHDVTVSDMASSHALPRADLKRARLEESQRASSTPLFIPLIAPDPDLNMTETGRIRSLGCNLSSTLNL
jgi:hypothetical protein